jgi:hypothetical protein
MTTWCRRLRAAQARRPLSPNATIRLRESGMTVYGAGERKTPKPFLAACDKSNFTVSRTAAAGQGSATGA